MRTQELAAEPAGVNEAVVYGQLVTEPEYRELPSGSRAASFSLTVRRPGEKTTSVPISWIDPPARLEAWQVGDMIVARGPVVRRFYRSAGGLASATEVVVARAELARHRAKANKVVAQAEASLVEVRTSLGA